MSDSEEGELLLTKEGADDSIGIDICHSKWRDAFVKCLDSGKRRFTMYASGELGDSSAILKDIRKIARRYNNTSISYAFEIHVQNFTC